MLIALIGPPGEGKTYSLRNMNPKDTWIVSITNRELTFQPNEFSKKNKNFIGGYKTLPEILKIIELAHNKGIKNVVIDDFHYIMAEAFMKRSMEKTYDKFTQIGYDIYRFFSITGPLVKYTQKMNIIITSHVELKGDNTISIKTRGKMVDQNYSLEGLFDVILHLETDESGEHFFKTKKSDGKIARTGGWFKEEYTENDLAKFLKLNEELKNGATKPESVE